MVLQTNFVDQIAIVTGAGSGIGKAIAQSLAELGASLCLVGRRVETLEEVAQSVQTIGVQVRCYRADLALDGDIQQVTTQIQRDCACVDVLVHSAGVISLGKIEVASGENFDWQYRVNVRAPYLLTQAMLPLLRLRGGQIVFMNSSVGLAAKANVGQYAATKHALKAVADSVREEVNADGIRVLSVYIGRTATPMQATVHEQEGKIYQPHFLLRPEDVAAVVINALSLARTAEVTDISIRPLRKSR